MGRCLYVEKGRACSDAPKHCVDAARKPLESQPTAPNTGSPKLSACPYCSFRAICDDRVIINGAACRDVCGQLRASA